MKTTEKLFQLYEAVCDNANLTTIEGICGNSYPYQCAVHGHRMSIQDLFWECSRLFEDIKSEESYTWIGAMAIKRYLDLSLPLIPIPATEVMAGDTTRITVIRELMGALEATNYREEWIHRQEQLRGFAEPMGIHLSDAELEHPEDYCDLILYAKKNICVCQVQRGTDCTEHLQISEYMYAFDTETDFVRALRKQQGSCIVLAYIEHSEHLNKRHGQIVAGVKHGENIWLAWEGRSQTILDAAHFYKCGKRISYMPYQVLFDGAQLPADSTFVDTGVTCKKWKISDYLDTEQRIFFPFFLNHLIQETVQSHEEQPLYLISGETEFVSGQTGTLFPCVVEARNCIRIPELDQILTDFCSRADDPESKKRAVSVVNLAHFFRLTMQDVVQDMPVPVFLKTQEKCMEDMPHELGERAVEILQQRVKELYAYDSTYWLQDMERVAQKVASRMPVIIDEVFEGKYADFATVSIHNAPVLKNGKPICQKPYHWANHYCPFVMLNSVTDTRVKYIASTCVTYLPGAAYGKLPPVELILKPKTTEEIIQLTGWAEKEVPVFYRIQGDVENLFSGYTFQFKLVLAMGKNEYKRLNVRGLDFPYALEHVELDEKKRLENTEGITVVKNAEELRTVLSVQQGKER